MRFFVAIILVLVLTQSIFSQQDPVTDNIIAKGTVITHISVTAIRELDFGSDIVLGVPKIVNISAANSGKFSFAGQVSREIAVTFTLPSILTSGANTMPIKFTSTDAGYVNTSSPMNVFNPEKTKNVKFGAMGTIDIYLGGKVIPALSQISGVYTALVNLSLQYTTN